MIDVAPSVSLDQRLDCPHDPTSTQFTTANPSYLQIPDLHSASFCGFEFSGQIFDSTFLDIQGLPAIITMLQQTSTQQSDQDLSHSPQSHSQYSPVEAQQAMLPVATPSFVEPSVNYFAIPSTAATPFFTSLMTPPPSTIQTSSSVNGSVDSRGYINTAGVVTMATQHNYHHQLQDHHSSSRSSQLLIDNFRLTQGSNSYDGDSVPGHHYLPQRMIYTNELGTTGARQNPQNHYNRKPVPMINTSLPLSPANSFSRPNSAASSPVNSSIAQQLLTPTIGQVLNTTNNDNGHDENTMHLPMFESNNPSSTAWTSPAATTITIPQNIPVSSSPEIASPTTPTYSYSGPPKSYYSRLPLYDRPFRCDQCPQSFNRNHDLKRHKRIHLAVKPYPCQYCEKQFSRKDALKRHILVKGCNNNSLNRKTNVTGNGTSAGESSSTASSTNTRKMNNNDNGYYGI